MAAEGKINLKKRFVKGKKVKDADMHTLIDSIRPAIDPVPAADVSGLADMVAGAMGSEKIIGLASMPEPGIGNTYYVPIEAGVYWNFSKRGASHFNLNIRTDDDSAWTLAEITSIGIRHNTGEYTAMTLIKDGTYWTLDNVTTGGPASWARTDAIIPIEFFVGAVEIVTTSTKLVFDLKFMSGPDAGATTVSRTNWAVPFDTEIEIPMVNKIEVLEGESCMIYGSPEVIFIKLNSRIFQDATKKTDFVSIAPTTEKYPSEKAVDSLVKDLLPADQLSVNTAGTGNNADLMNLNIRRDGGGTFTLDDIKELRIVNDLGDVIIVSLVLNSYWGNSGDSSGFPDWARSDIQFPIAGRAVSVELELNSPIDDFIFDLKFMKGAVLISKTMWVVGFGKKIPIGLTDYSSVTAFNTAEAAGRKDVLVKGVFNEVNPNIHLKNGDTLIGEGMGKTVLRLSFDETAGLRGLFAEATVKVSDMTIETVEDNSAAASDRQSYALHIDAPGTFISHFLRVHLKSTLKFPDYVNPIENVAITLGIGIWDTQRFLLEDSILESQNIFYGNKNGANTHNQVSNYDEVTPGNVCMKNCTITGGFSSILVADVNDGPGSNATRPKALWEFLGCTIDSLRLKSFDPFDGNSSPNRTNGFKFNVAGSKCGLITGANDMIDTSLPSYEVTSLPMFPNVRFFKNAGATVIADGDPVCYIYGLRKDHWYPGNLVHIPIAIEKMNSTNYRNFAGFSLVDSAAGDFCHIVVRGLAKTNITTGDLNDYLSPNASGGFTVNAAYGSLKVHGKDSVTDEIIVDIL